MPGSPPMEPSVLFHPCLPWGAHTLQGLGVPSCLSRSASIYGELVCARHWGDRSVYNGKSPALLELLLISMRVSIYKTLYYMWPLISTWKGQRVVHLALSVNFAFSGFCHESCFIYLSYIIFQSSFGKYLGSFHVFTVSNSAAVINCVEAFLRTLVSFVRDKCLRVQIIGSCVKCMFSIVDWKKYMCLKVESRFIWWESWGLQARETASQVTLRELFLRRWGREEPGYLEVFQKRQVIWILKDYC